MAGYILKEPGHWLLLFAGSKLLMVAWQGPGHAGVDQHGAGALGQDDGEECPTAGNGYVTLINKIK